MLTGFEFKPESEERGEGGRKASGVMHQQKVIIHFISHNRYAPTPLNFI